MALKENSGFSYDRRPSGGAGWSNQVFPSRCTTAAALLLTAAIFIAPWPFGSRPYWAALSLNGLLISAVGLWFFGCFRERRLPAVPAVCWCVVISLAALAGVSILNPQSTFDVALGLFLPNPACVPFLPATVDASTGWTFTLEMIAYLFVIPTAADLSRSALWRGRFLGTIAMTGLLVAIAGLTLKAGCWPQLQNYLEQRPWAQGEIFGPFDYHGNAGAFLNLALPATAWSAASCGRGRRVFWWCAVGILYLALAINSSRAALVIGLFLSPVTCGFMLRRTDAARSFFSSRWRRWILISSLLVIVLVGCGVLVANRDSAPIRRWQRLPTELSRPEYPRYLQSRAAWELAQEHPFFGSGVGSYKVLVQTSSIRGYFFAPYFRPGDPFTVLGHTHEDYLQTLVEWGWVGFCGWAVLVSGAFVMLWKMLRRTKFGSRTALAVGLALFGVYSHALGDCPLQIPAIQFYVALCLGMAWGSNRWQSESPAALTA